MVKIGIILLPFVSLNKNVADEKVFDGLESGGEYTSSP